LELPKALSKLSTGQIGTIADEDQPKGKEVMKYLSQRCNPKQFHIFGRECQ
jgi:hypothetical protein